MRKLLVFMFLGLLVIGCSTFKKVLQEQDKQVIKAEFSKYLELIVNREFEKAMDYVLPDLFDIVPRSIMVDAMKKAFQNPDFEFKLEDSKIRKVTFLGKIKGEYYAKVTYSNKLYMKMVSIETDSAELRQSTLDLLESSFKRTFGEKNVTFDRQTGFFEIYSKKDAVAISQDKASGWKFLVAEEKQKPILWKILPKEILDELYKE